MYSFPNSEPVCHSIFDSNCYFLTSIQVLREAGKVVWYSHLLKNFPQFVVIHTVKGFGIINKTEANVFLKFPCFFYDPMDDGNMISGSSAFSKSSLYMWKFSVKMFYCYFLDYLFIYFWLPWSFDAACGLSFVAEHRL